VILQFCPVHLGGFTGVFSVKQRSAEPMTGSKRQWLWLVVNQLGLMRDVQMGKMGILIEVFD